MPKRNKRVREPVQVYLDERDRDLLDTMSERTSLPRAELLRLGLRRLSEQMLGERRAGSSLAALKGALDQAGDVPPDLAARHDEYLYGDREGPDQPRRG